MSVPVNPDPEHGHTHLCARGPGLVPHPSAEPVAATETTRRAALEIFTIWPLAGKTYWLLI